MNVIGLEEQEPTSPEEDIARAQRVGALGNSADFQYLQNAVARTAIEDWANGKTVEDREAAWQRYQTIRAFDTEIQKVVDQGTRAADALNAAESES